jgi:hypothetical protein
MHDPSMVRDLSAALKQEALPFLSRIKLPQDVAGAAAALEKFGDPYVQQAIAYAVARGGDSRRATGALTHFLGTLKANSEYPWQREMRQRAEDLKSEFRDNPSLACQRFDSWQIETTKLLGLEEFS